MRRIALCALTALLWLGGCGPQSASTPSLHIGLIGEPLSAAPVILSADALPLPWRIVQGQAALQASYLIAPSSVLPQLAAQGWVALGAACARPPDALLWHQEGLFSWQDLRGASLYIAPGADASALDAGIARYAGVLSPLPRPIAQDGGTAGFAQDPAGFLLAPEPLASALVAEGKAALAQPLPDELGPYPTCLLLARRSALSTAPLLTLQVVRAMDLGLWRLATENPGSIALALRPLSPATAPSALLRAVLAARSEGIFAQALTISGSARDDLLGEFADGNLPQGAIDERVAQKALLDPFRH